MSYKEFQELVSACYISRVSVEEKYNANPSKPWSYSYWTDYTDEKRNIDASNFLDYLFEDEKEVDLEKISSNISSYKEKIKKTKGPIWSVIGNINVTIAKSASESFRQYYDLLPEINIKDILKNGKDCPYGKMEFPNFIKETDNKSYFEGTHDADHEAGASMYGGDLLALVIAREYDFEELLP